MDDRKEWKKIKCKQKPSDIYSKILCSAQASKSFNETDDSMKLSCSDAIINNRLCWFTVNYAMLKKFKSLARKHKQHFCVESNLERVISNS